MPHILATIYAADKAQGTRGSLDSSSREREEEGVLDGGAQVNFSQRISNIFRCGSNKKKKKTQLFMLHSAVWLVGRGRVHSQWRSYQGVEGIRLGNNCVGAVREALAMPQPI